MAKVINTVIKLRKDKEVNYQKVENSFIPANGEVCLVDTEEYGLRVKVGNGVDNFKTLSYQDNNNNVVLNGYFLNNKFYTDSTYTKELGKGMNHLYIDKNSNSSIFVWTGTEFRNVAPEATDTIAGIMKLYQEAGNNSDGTISQKIITEGVNSIALKLNDSDTECLELDLPWD